VIPPPIDDLADAIDGHPQVAPEPVDADPEGLQEVFPQSLTWMDGRQPASLSLHFFLRQW